MTTHVYRRLPRDGNYVWVVGYDASFIGEPGGFTRLGPEFILEEDAAVYTSFLNGGRAIGPWAHRHIYGTVHLASSALTLLLQGGDINYPLVTLMSAQIANRLTNKDTIIGFFDGNSTAKPLGFLGCNQANAIQFNFEPGLISTSSIYCSAVDATTDAYVSAQGVKIRGSPPP